MEEMVKSMGSNGDIKFQLRKDFELVKEQLPDLLYDILKAPEFKVELDFGLVFRPDMETARCKREEGEIHFGTNNKKLKSLKVSRKTLIHEAIHAAGVNHDGKMRSLNFYSQLPRDLFTDKIMEKLGWEPPTEKETRKCSRRRRTLDYKYVAYCPECGNSWYRKKKSKLIKHPGRYYCRDCNVDLESRELTEEEREEINV